VYLKIFINYRYIQNRVDNSLLHQKDLMAFCRSIGVSVYYFFYSRSKNIRHKLVKFFQKNWWIVEVASIFDQS